jgi:hypothetical protein
MLADIVTGETGVADFLFLLAACSAGIYFVLDLLAAKGLNLLALAVCLISVAFLLL